MDENFAVNRFLPMAFGLYYADSLKASNNPPPPNPISLITNGGDFLVTNNNDFLITN